MGLNSPVAAAQWQWGQTEKPTLELLLVTIATKTTERFHIVNFFRETMVPVAILEGKLY